MEAFEMTGPSGNKYRIDENGDVFLLEKPQIPEKFDAREELAAGWIVLPDNWEATAPLLGNGNHE